MQRIFRFRGYDRRLGNEGGCESVSGSRAAGLRTVWPDGLLGVLGRGIGRRLGQFLLLLVPFSGKVVVIGSHLVELLHHFIAVGSQLGHLFVLGLDIVVLLFDVLVG